MNEIEEIKIENMIYEIRGKQVMLDSDLAKLYGCKNGTKSLNLSVKRNMSRFPEEFMFQLTEEESKKLWFQIETKKTKMERRGGKYNKPFVFTEEGVAMLATIIRTPIAEQTSIKIMKAFIKMRRFINENKDLFRRLTVTEYKLLEHDDKINELFDKLEPKKIEKQKIFFNGEIYDAYSLIIDLISKAKVRIIIIDNYIDKSILDMLVYKKEDVEVTLITSSHYLTKLDINKFNSQYPNLKIKYSNMFHDRFLIIDNTLYHIGSSLKDLGKKCFCISIIEDKEYLTKILEKIL